MGAGDVADIVEVEGKYGAQARMADRFLRPLHPRLVQTIVINALLPILGHRAPRGGRLRAIVFHRCSSGSHYERLVQMAGGCGVLKIGRGIARRPIPTLPATKENAELRGRFAQAVGTSSWKDN